MTTPAQRAAKLAYRTRRRAAGDAQPTFWMTADTRARLQAICAQKGMTAEAVFAHAVQMMTETTNEGTTP